MLYSIAIILVLLWVIGMMSSVILFRVIGASAR